MALNKLEYLERAYVCVSVLTVCCVTLKMNKHVALQSGVQPVETIL